MYIDPEAEIGLAYANRMMEMFDERSAAGEVCAEHGDYLSLRVLATQELSELVALGATEEDIQKVCETDEVIAETFASLQRIHGFTDGLGEITSQATIGNFLKTGNKDKLDKVVALVARKLDEHFPDGMSTYELLIAGDGLPQLVHTASWLVTDKQRLVVGAEPQAATQMLSELLVRMKPEDICGSLHSLGPEQNELLSTRSSEAADLIRKLLGYNMNPTFIEGFIRNRNIMADDARRVHDLLRAMPEVAVTPEQLVEMNQANTALMKELLRIKTYGIKNIDFPFGDVMPDMDLVLHSPGEFATGQGGSRAQAIVRLVDAKANEQDKVNINRRLDYEKDGLKQYLFNGLMVMAVDADGEIHTGATPDRASISLRKLFEYQGKGAQYEFLRAEILRRFFDAVAPAHVVNKIYESVAIPRQQGDQQERPAPDPTDIVRRILLPRIRYVRENTRKQLDADHAVEMRSAEDANAAQRRLRLHTVPGFLRPLPRGSRASARAHALFHDAYPNDPGGIPEGYTFVQEHKRGDARFGTVLGYVAARSATDRGSDTTEEEGN